MHLAIFGGTGRTGQHLVQQALDQGHQVTALARTPSRLPQTSDHLTVVQGDVTDPSAVQRAVAGADAVISVLGPTKNEPTFEISRGTQNILSAMQQSGVKRLIIAAGAGVRDPQDKPGLFDKAIGLLLKLVSRYVYEDMLRTVELVRSSDRDWTVVRVPMLTDSEKTGQVKVGYLGGVGTRIDRADMADFILQQVHSDRYLCASPVISS